MLEFLILEDVGVLLNIVTTFYKLNPVWANPDYLIPENCLRIFSSGNFNTNKIAQIIPQGKFIKTFNLQVEWGRQFLWANLFKVQNQAVHLMHFGGGLWFVCPLPAKGSHQWIKKEKGWKFPI